MKDGVLGAYKGKFFDTENSKWVIMIKIMWPEYWESVHLGSELKYMDKSTDATDVKHKPWDKI